MSAQPLWGGEQAGLHYELAQRGFSTIEHNIPSEIIDELQEAHANFSENLPDPEPETLNAMMVDVKDLDRLDYSKDTQKEWHKYRTNTPDSSKPNGYTNRFYQAEVLRQFDRPVYEKKTGQWVTAYEDPKEFYHYMPSMRQAMDRRHERYSWGRIPMEVKLLGNQMHRVHRLARTALSEAFYELEATHPQINKIITPDVLIDSPLRNLLYYKGQGKHLAGGHYDKGVFTMQVADSHRGLRVRDKLNGKMRLIDTPPTVSPVFTAEKWETAFPGTELEAMWHDVIDAPVANEDRHLHGTNIARWALIFFVNNRGVGKHDKTSTHIERPRSK